jgi:excisionase family DNA binding protein
MSATNGNATENGLAGRMVISPYLTAPEAAIYLRTTVLGVYSLVKRGRLKPMPGRPGRLLFTQAALDQYLTARPRG